MTSASILEYSLPTMRAVSPTVEVPDFSFMAGFRDTSSCIAYVKLISFICLSTKFILMAQANLHLLPQFSLPSQLKATVTIKRLLPSEDLTIGGSDNG